LEQPEEKAVRQLLALVFLLAISATSVMAQQHAPTVAQCRADVALWGNGIMVKEYYDAENAHMEDGTPDHTDVARLPVQEVILHRREMGDCASVDAENHVEYYEAARFYATVHSNRIFNFMARHNLWNQFRAEDAQGLR
jgi:hypothetical protein